MNKDELLNGEFLNRFKNSKGFAFFMEKRYVPGPEIIL